MTAAAEAIQRKAGASVEPRRMLRAEEFGLALDQVTARLSDMRVLAQHAEAIERENLVMRDLVWRLLGMLLRVGMGEVGVERFGRCDAEWFVRAAEAGPVPSAGVVEKLERDLDACSQSVVRLVWGWIREGMRGAKPESVDGVDMDRLRVVSRLAWSLGVDCMAEGEDQELFERLSAEAE